MKLLVVYLIGIYGGVGIATDCPCESPTLCEPVDTPVSRKELFVFSVNNQTWKQWNWTAITTVIAFGYHDYKLMCFAHAHKARYGMAVGINPTLLKNHTATELWLNQTLDAAERRFSDAINIDTEQAIAKGSPERDLLTQVVKKLTQRFKQRNPSNQVTFDLAWQPGGVDGRFYDEKAIAEIVDFVFIMSYDTQSQMFTSDCRARANTPYPRIVSGYSSYISLGIPANKLVMGLPWYGYHYSCEAFDNVTDTCHIREVPFRGVNCSDAAGSEYDFSRIIRLLNSTGAEKKWSTGSLSPYFQYYDNRTKTWNQVWYDDPPSLLYKLEYGFYRGLKGVGMWNADELDYSSVDPNVKSLTQTMWTIFTEWVLSAGPEDQTTPVIVRTSENSPVEITKAVKATKRVSATTTKYDVRRETSERTYVGDARVCFGGKGTIVAVLISVLLVGILSGCLIIILAQRYLRQKAMKYQQLEHQGDDNL